MFSTFKYQLIQGIKNQSWTSLAPLLFTKLRDEKPSIKFYKRKNETILVQLFMWPFSRCLEIKDFQKILAMGFKDDVEIFLVDPSLYTSHRINKLAMSGYEFTMPSRNSTTFGRNKIFYVSTTVINKRPEKNTCTVYNTVDGYSKCIEKNYVKKFMELLSCLPPWFKVILPEHLNIPTCSYPVHLSDQLETANVKNLLHIITYSYRFMKDVKIEEEFCRHPCKKLMYNLELMQEEQADYDVNWIDLKFADLVVVKNEISNYDAFRLIVEVCILPCKLYEISG